MRRNLDSKLAFPLFLCLGLLLLMVGTSQVRATPSISTPLFSESFDYPDGTVLLFEGEAGCIECHTLVPVTLVGARRAR